MKMQIPYSHSLRETWIPSSPSLRVDSNLKFNLPFSMGGYTTVRTKYGSICSICPTRYELPPWQANQRRLQEQVSFVCMEILRSRNKHPGPLGNSKLTSDAIHIAETMTVEEIYAFSISGKSGSQLTQEVIVQLDRRRQRRLCQLYQANIEEVLENEFACYVLKTAVSYSKSLLKSALEISQRSFHNMVASPGRSRVLMALSDFSEEFRSYGLAFFKKHFIKLVSNLDAMILLSQLILKTNHKEELTFVKDSLVKEPWVVDQPLVRRILGGFLENCLLEDAKGVFWILKPHFSWLIGDRYGNFIIRVLMERNVETIVPDCIKECLKNYKTIFHCCYSRFTILWLLKMKGTCFAQAWIATLMRTDSGLEEMFAKNINTNLLLLAISKVTDPLLMAHFKVAYRRLKTKKLERNPRYSKHLVNFDQSFLQLIA